LQALPLSIKIKKAEQLILHMISNYDMFTSVSGIDSIVMNDIVQKVAKRVNRDVKSVFINTGLEEKSVVKYAKENTDVIIYPKSNFKEILMKYGYPIISKEQSRYIDNIRNDNVSDKRKKELLSPYGQTHYRLSDKWRYLLDSDFKISDKCCYYMKKRPSLKYSNKTETYPFIGIMADESKTRKDSWVTNGCNIESSKIKSRPLMIFTKQNILQYIYENDLKYPSVYGEIYLDDSDEKSIGDIYKTTGVDSTSCIYCGYGKHNDNGKPNDFTRLKKEDLKRYEYVIGGGEYVNDVWIPSKTGLGLGHVLDVYGVNYDSDDYYNVKYNKDTHVKFKAISPNGEIYYHFDIHAFAYYFNLIAYDIEHVLEDEYIEHKGWDFKYVNEFIDDWTVDNCNDKIYELSKGYKVYNNYNFFKAINGTDIYYAYNQRAFAREFKLSKQCIYKCLHDKQKKHKGWTFKFVEELPIDLDYKEDEDIFKYR